MLLALKPYLMDPGMCVYFIESQFQEDIVITIITNNNGLKQLF